MTKFNVGDSIEFIEKYGSYEVGDKVTLTAYGNNLLISFEGEKGEGCAFESRFKLSEKPTKNQRITALENELSETKNEVAELKLIVHEIRNGRKTMRDVMNEVLSEPSTTNTVEDIIEFEGQQYKKVDRLAIEGDVVVFDKSVKFQGTEIATKGKLYKAKKGTLGELAFVDNEGDSANVYDGGITKFTPENVAVYELIEEGLNPQIPILDETIEPLTPNQQRAVIIEKAKNFVTENVKFGRTSDRHTDKGNSTYRNNYFDVDFFVKGRKVTAVVYWLEFNEKRVSEPSNVGRAKCNPNDVFNEHIGKAISLGRALGLEVSEFEQAVQPTVAIGQLIESHSNVVYKVFSLENSMGNVKYKAKNGSWQNAEGGDLPNETWYKIINDSNVIYKEGSN